MYITVHRAGPSLFVKPRIEDCIVLPPRISLCRVCNRHVIGSADLRGNHPIDLNSGSSGLVEKGLLKSEGSGRSTFLLPSRPPPDGEICSKPSSEHLPESSEHLDALREVAGPVRSVRKAPRKIVEATILRLCEGRYPTLDDLADLYSHLRCSGSGSAGTSHPSAGRQSHFHPVPEWVIT